MLCFMNQSKQKGNDQELTKPVPTFHPRNQNEMKRQKLINVQERHARETE